MADVTKSFALAEVLPNDFRESLNKCGIRDQIAGLAAKVGYNCAKAGCVPGETAVLIQFNPPPGESNLCVKVFAAEGDSNE